MKIIKYNSWRDIYVQFEDEHKAIVNSRYDCFRDKCIKNPYDRTLCGIGFLGEAYINKETNIKSISKWRSMINRCYYEPYLKRERAYEKCTVCEEWHNYSNFKKWYDENYYIIDGKTVELDKDIKYNNNNVYSPETCLFIPTEINRFLVNATNIKQRKHDNLPTGVSLHSINNTYIVQVTHKTKTFYNIQDAFYYYKRTKEKAIKELAIKYKESIPIHVFNYIYNYEVKDQRNIIKDGESE
jgi:hypothetical protein